MKRLVAALLSLFLLAAPVSIAQEESDFPSIRPLAQFGGREVCTTFSINKDKGYWATANHCIDPLTTYYIDNRSVYVIDQFEDDDLAVMKGAYHQPALKLRKDRLEVGDNIHVIGYPGGLHEMIMVNGIMAARNFVFTVILPDGTFAKENRSLYMMPTMPGHSGSPVLDDNDELVGIAQISNGGSFSGGLQLEKLRKDLKKYVE